MKTKILTYLEMIPDEGKMLTDGNIVTDYVCALNEEKLTSIWYEIDKVDEGESDEGESDE